MNAIESKKQHFERTGMFFYKGACLGEMNERFFEIVEKINPLDHEFEFEDFGHFLDECCELIDSGEFKKMSEKDQSEKMFFWSSYIYLLTTAGVLENDEMNGMVVAHKIKTMHKTETDFTGLMGNFDSPKENSRYKNGSNNYRVVETELKKTEKPTKKEKQKKKAKRKNANASKRNNRK